MRVELKNFQYSEITLTIIWYPQDCCRYLYCYPISKLQFFNKIEQLNMIQKLQTTKPSFNLLPPHLFSCYQGEISHQQRLLTVFFAHGQFTCLEG